MPKVRAAVITDIHYGFDHKDKLGSRGPALMDRFVKWTERLKSKPVFTVEMGDRVNSRNEADDRNFMQELKNQFNRLAMPVYHLLGNHDVKNLSRTENEEITGSPSSSYSLDEGDWHFVFWNPQVALGGGGITVTAADIQWLKQDLDATVRKTAVFCHVPFYDRNEEREKTEYAGNPIANRFSFESAPALREIFEQSGKVRLAMGGHRHQNICAEINGVHYITLQSLTSEYKRKRNVPSGTWSMLEFCDDRISVKLYGKAKMRIDGELKNSYTLHFPKAGSEPPPPGAPLP